MNDKWLVLRDLTARLPYDVKVWVKTHQGQVIESDFLTLCNGGGYYSTLKYEGIVNDSEIKPYLRPLLSMTREERFEVEQILGDGVEIADGYIRIIDSEADKFSFEELQAVFDWLLAHHFDIRDLIKKGLALEAPADMYK